MKILVFGASGKTGQEIVQQGLASGHHVTAFTRNPSKLKITNENLRIIQGDITNYQLVEDAVKGQDAVLSALGASSPFKFDQAVVDGVANIIKVMQALDVSRFIYMSFIGVKESRSAAGFVIKYIAPKLLSTEIAGHEAREKMITQSQLQWTIVRPPTLTNGKHTGKYKMGENITANGFTVTISRADVADCMLKQLTGKDFLNKTLRVMY
jgi:putative NADH-flavin reductase